MNLVQTCVSKIDFFATIFRFKVAAAGFDGSVLELVCSAFAPFTTGLVMHTRKTIVFDCFANLALKMALCFENVCS